MRLTLRARIIALAGAGVMLAAGLFAAIVMPALRSFEEAIARQQTQARAAVADSIGRYAFARGVHAAADSADPELNALLQPLRSASAKAALVDERGRLLAGDAIPDGSEATTRVPGTEWTIRASTGGDLSDSVRHLRLRSTVFALTLAMLAMVMAAGVTRELASANRRLEERERVRRQLLHRIISAQEDERKRVARELHDELSQSIAALGLAVDAAGRPDLRALVQRINKELHRVIVDLRPAVLDDLGLASAIRWCAERLASRGIAVRCEIGEIPPSLSPEVETAVFRAVQEAIVNIERHAQADTALIQVYVGPQSQRRRSELVVEIEDDGVGFDPKSVGKDPRSLRGVGMLGMRERIEIVGGALTVESEPGSGTRVVMQVPVEEEPCQAAAS